MRQLTSLDAQFLHAESATTAAHVAGVAVLDPACAPTGAVTRDALIGLLRERLHLAPALTLRLADVPFGLDHPYWTEDPSFDVADHVYETTLPMPGDEAQLAEAVARIHGRRLDRSRPLWEMHLIQGLTGGRAALYAKVHHCAVDGISGAETLAALLDLTPEPRTVEPPAGHLPTVAPGLARMLAGAAVRSLTHPLRVLRSLGRSVGDLDAIPVAAGLPGARLVAAATRTLTGSPRSLPALPSLSAPRTPFNGPISAQRLFSYGSLPLADVRRVAKASGSSVNDVVMALCAAALRSWLREHDALPDRPLIAAVPVAVRTASAREVVGNQISAMITPIPTHVACPLERLRAAGEAMRTAKRRFARSPATWPNELSSMMPAAVTAMTTSALFRLASIAPPPVNLIISNVPGPQFPLYLCGARVLSYYPMSVLTDVSGGVNITCFSYNGSLDFGIVSCPERVEDAWRLMGHLQEAMDELVELAGPRPAPRGAGAQAAPTDPSSIGSARRSSLFQ
ncbi:wax ester/triacylglycerol synthase family O-acyltransferase [Planomonospora sp. ID67723]|uniref:WS/DGAT/MGAT family O-acyltransferase n=1 Tax=Planomonospora sp. ID67723 TaxID=2738134 RepID=UPI0018C4089B|nr:wax ester/triacylglycerol synthase family O-acyltransferase [Planomonospora sp. ID67723]MBG0831082.1 wax ester/triacylglycerol synthase family O-acyltransferase [Planomonospora sp. ID67723]